MPNFSLARQGEKKKEKGLSLAQVGRQDPQSRSCWTGIFPLALGWRARSWARKALLWLETS